MINRNARGSKVEPVKYNSKINQSGLISSSQQGLHPNLEQVVRKHLHAPWQQPLHKPTVALFQQLLGEGAFTTDRPLILDSGCGTGSSSIELAALFPDALVMGVDRSQARLARSGAQSGFYRDKNVVLLRAELSTFWRLMFSQGLRLYKHYLLYPNPYPKPGHLSRRWHGHPVFPQLLGLGGDIEMRCNWEIYAAEFAQAVNIACQSKLVLQNYQAESGISRFEQKYIERNQSLYSVTVPMQVLDDFSQHWQAPGA